MRILISSTSYYPYISGVSVFARHSAQHLANSGHDVFVIAPDKSSHMHREHKPDQNVLVIRVPSYPNPFHRHFRVPVLTPGSIRTLLQELKPDVIHVQDPLPFNLLLRNEARKLNIPVVVTHHFTMELLLAYFPKFTRPFVRWVVTMYLVWFYNGCDAVTCPTPTTMKTLERDGVTSTLVAISNGVDIERFGQKVDLEKVRRSLGIPSGVPVLLYLGRIDKDKSVDVVVDAMGLVLADRKAHAVIAGTGDLLETMKARAESLGIQGQVTFTGQIPNDDDCLPGLYQLATLFVTASTIETQGIVILEAMSAGKPIVAANAGAIPEVVLDGKNGFLVKPGDVVAFSKAIEKILDDRALLHAMSRASVRIVQPHGLNESMKKFERLYVECAQKSHALEPVEVAN